MSRRGVLDIRTGRLASLGSIFGDGEVKAIERARDASLHSAVDSLRARRDQAGTRASAQLAHYRLDPSSFAITTVAGIPAVEFALPGAGAGDAGHLLPLPAIPVHTPGWWGEVATTLPVRSVDGNRDSWRRPTYSVVVRYDSTGDAVLSVRDSTSREWRVRSIAAPAHRIFWLDSTPFDSTMRRALAQAFTDASNYDSDGRVALRRAPASVFLASRSR